MKTEILDALSTAKKEVESFNTFDRNIDRPETKIRALHGGVHIDYHSERYSSTVSIPDFTL